MSKRIWQHPEVPAGETTVAWRSAGQLEDTPAFREWLDREFPQGAAEMAGEGEMESSRRSFLKLMGASTALAGFGMAACRRPVTYIVPYTKAPEWVIPGKATYYASAMPRSNGATPLVVTTFEGRPTKLAPNNLHPDAGGTDAFAQASVLDLYSPSRSRKVLKSSKVAKRADFEAAIAALAADIAGPSSLPEAAPVACGPDPKSVGERGMVVIENHADTPLKVNERQYVRSLVRISLLYRTDLEGAALEAEIDRLTDEAMRGDEHARTVEPGMRLHFLNPVGAQLHLIGSDCLIVGAEATRFDWTGS